MTVTPEERAVIEAALGWYEGAQDLERSPHRAVLRGACAALCAARQPKPRYFIEPMLNSWYLGENMAHGCKFHVAILHGSHVDRERADRICAALNRAADSERGEP